MVQHVVVPACAQVRAREGGSHSFFAALPQVLQLPPLPVLPHQHHVPSVHVLEPDQVQLWPAVLDERAHPQPAELLEAVQPWPAVLPEQVQPWPDAGLASDQQGVEEHCQHPPRHLQAHTQPSKDSRCT
jgi:hypothetical protein